MNPGRFYMPRLGTSFNPMMGANYLSTRGNIGLFGRITNSLRSFNWSGLLNGASKTLNVVNQTIPLVRQAGPMVNNMKSMFKIARAFGSETNNRINFNNNNKNNNSVNSSTMISNNHNNKVVNNTVKNQDITLKNTTITSSINDSYPNFFL